MLSIFLQSKFRISGTGVIVDQDKSSQVVKKLKLVGTPLKVFKNTAFVKVGFYTILPLFGLLLRNILDLKRLY